MRPFSLLHATSLILSLNLASPFRPLTTNGIRTRLPPAVQDVRHLRESSLLKNSIDDNDFGQDAVLENEEPLSVIFQRGVVLQRSGDHLGALKEYKLFIKAAEGCGVSPDMFAEVHVNIGAVYFKDAENEDLAKHHFELAIGYRPVGTAYVNLALIALRKGASAGTTDPAAGRACLEEARTNLEKAIELGDTEQSKMAAIKLLEDVKAITKQMNLMG